jgi:hypothetical protein
MPFAYNVAMTGIDKHIRNAMKFEFTGEFFSES